MAELYLAFQEPVYLHVLLALMHSTEKSLIIGRRITSSRFPICVLLALSWNTNENPSTDKLSRAINYLFITLLLVSRSPPLLLSRPLELELGKEYLFC